VANNKEDIQSLKKDRLDEEEVAGPNVRVVALQELPPAWGWASIVARIHVLGDGPGGNRKSQSRQFGLDSFLTP
jgi:hypothetical protein